MNRVELKKDAKSKLKEYYARSIVVVLLWGIIFIISIFLEFRVPVLGKIISWVLTCIFVFGYYYYFFKISSSEEATINDLWSLTNMGLKYFCVTFLKKLFIFLWTLLLIIPGYIASYSYRLAYYIILDDPDISCMDAIKLSKELMNGYKKDLFILDLSFILWIIASILTCGLLLLYVIPYMAITEANFYNYVINEYLEND